MGYFEHTEKLKGMEFFIRNRIAVTPVALSQKLNVSTRTVQRMADELRLQNKKLEYCRKLKGYFIED